MYNYSKFVKKFRREYQNETQRGKLNLVTLRFMNALEMLLFSKILGNCKIIIFHIL